MELDELTSLAERIGKLEGRLDAKLVAVFSFEKSFQKLEIVESGSGEIGNRAYDLQFVFGKPQVMVQQLQRSVAQMRHLIELHNHTIDTLKSVDDQETRIFRTLGLVEGSGSTDETFRHSVENLHLATESIMFFGLEILQELENHYRFCKSLDGQVVSATLSIEDEWVAKLAELRKKPTYKTWETFKSITSRPI